MTTEADKGLVVIGIGNVLREDDGVGYRIAEALMARNDSRMRCRAVTQLTVDLVEEVSAARKVIFFDANARLAPGEISESILHPDSTESFGFSHEMSPRKLLQICRILNGDSPPAVLFEIGGDQFGLGEKLSKPVQIAAQIVLENVLGLIR